MPLSLPHLHVCSCVYVQIQARYVRGPVDGASVDGDPRPSLAVHGTASHFAHPPLIVSRDETPVCRPCSEDTLADLRILRLRFVSWFIVDGESLLHPIVMCSLIDRQSPWLVKVEVQS